MKKIIFSIIYYIFSLAAAFVFLFLISTLLSKVSVPKLSPDEGLDSIGFGILPILLTPFLGLFFGLFTREKVFKYFGLD